MWRQKQEAKQRVELAWMIAALSRQRKLPRLERLLMDPANKNTFRSPEERRAEYEDLKQRLG